AGTTMTTPVGTVVLIASSSRPTGADQSGSIHARGSTRCAVAHTWIEPFPSQQGMTQSLCR
ncbi:hypothetical protein, partial [Aldersonia kunmingensis]|uniref:hypothetical protein n=1 Tax=Aldersonia kunmingensis TaxID=408066 RepID=UPI001C9E5CDF